MKKYLIYIVLFIGGIFLGYLFFNESSSEEKHQHTEAEKKQLWTCSMHPQIERREPGDCPICGMDLIPAEAGADGLMADQFKMTDNAMALANIQTSIVGQGEIGNNILKLSGKIKAKEESNAVQGNLFWR